MKLAPSYAKVRLMRTIWSIQAFKAEGIEKLYMGVAINTVSAPSSSWISALDRAVASRRPASRASVGV